MIPVCSTSGDDTIGSFDFFWAAATRTSGCQNEDDTSMLPQGDDTTEYSDFFGGNVESCETSTLSQEPLPTRQQRHAHHECRQEARNARRSLQHQYHGGAF